MKSISGKHWEELNIIKRLIEKVNFDHNFKDSIKNIFKYFYRRRNIIDK